MSATSQKWAQPNESGRKLAEKGATTPKRAQLNKSASTFSEVSATMQKWAQLGQSERSFAKVCATLPKCAQVKDRGIQTKTRAQLTKRWAQPSESGRSNTARRRTFAKMSATEQTIVKLCKSGRNEAKVGAAWPKWARQYRSGRN